MKTLTIILSLSLASVAFAEDPAELMKLRKTWGNSVAGVQARTDALYREKMNKANKLYHEELKQMKDNFMAAKNLDGANAVDAEMKKLIALHGKQKFTPPKKTEEKPVVQKKTALEDLLEGVWIHNYAKGGTGTFVCKGDKMINDKGHIGKVTHHDGNLLVEWEGGGRHKLSVDPDNSDVIRYKNNLGRRGTYIRVKW